MRKDLIPGGLADKAEIKNFDIHQLLKGMKVEMEHTRNPNMAIEIAMDHLTEDPEYYTKLEKVEKAEESLSLLDIYKTII